MCTLYSQPIRAAAVRSDEWSWEDSNAVHVYELQHAVTILWLLKCQRRQQHQRKINNNENKILLLIWPAPWEWIHTCTHPHRLIEGNSSNRKQSTLLKDDIYYMLAKLSHCHTLNAAGSTATTHLYMFWRLLLCKICCKLNFWVAAGCC